MEILSSAPADLIDSQEAARLMGKTYRQFTAYASYHKLPQESEVGGSPLYVRALIQDHADLAAGRTRRGRARRMPLRSNLQISNQAEEAEGRIIVSASSALPGHPALNGSSEYIPAKQEMTIYEPARAELIDPLAVAVAQGRAQGLAQSERVLTAKDAAAILAISPALLRKSVPPWKRFGNSPRGDRWLLSQILSAQILPKQEGGAE